MLKAFQNGGLSLFVIMVTASIILIAVIGFMAMLMWYVQPIHEWMARTTLLDVFTWFGFVFATLGFLAWGWMIMAVMTDPYQRGEKHGIEKLIVLATLACVVLLLVGRFIIHWPF